VDLSHAARRTRLDVNDRDWINTTLRRFEAPLVLYAKKICGDVDRARDVVQDTFVELCAADRAVVEPKLAQWLFTVCRNKALDLRSKDRDMRNGDEDFVEDHASMERDPAATLAAEEENGRVLVLVERLPYKQQEVLRLKFQAGLSYKEIAAVTGDSTGNVGFLLHTALRALRERLAVHTNVTRKVSS
jgi:RNA polymerase sigma factor (sigma-70 family)